MFILIKEPVHYFCLATGEFPYGIPFLEEVSLQFASDFAGKIDFYSSTLASPSRCMSSHVGLLTPDELDSEFSEFVGITLRRYNETIEEKREEEKLLFVRC